MREIQVNSVRDAVARLFVEACHHLGQDVLDALGRALSSEPSPVGRYVLDRCDVLVAVWDGQPARGRGGTADIVAMARHCGKPMAWIRATHRELGALQDPVCCEAQGAVVFERFPSPGSASLHPHS